ncbi:Glycosyltransferase involved in cell wall bisynthesis [Nonomuraea solani]|uniref:Glycosyltransferase involved in cell wall bisynthesis n=1 Tax=Nonomuraea solani TaxID=1144553 RepID=A0A1H6CKV7_9ACTN|nr:glycosyltransferase [Nonomuraea solani]SEG73621.1 Glycosyltransferase involved in cell wall bisynthesis [Nonomuraea solani]
MTPRSPQERSTTSLIGRAEPPIGVGMPVYNGEPYLAGALRSVLAQKDADFELVIADNCSTDGTEELCREAARTDSRVRYIRRDRNIGVTANHNALMHETRGEFFSYATSDDEYREDRLALLSAALRRHPEAALALSGVEEIDENGQVIGHWRDESPTVQPDPVARLRHRLVNYDDTMHFYGLIRRETLLRARPLEPILPADRVIIAGWALFGPLVVVDELLLRHRNHAGSDSKVNHARLFRAREVPGDQRFYLPNVEEGRALLRMIHAAPLGFGQRLRAYAALRPWLRRNAVPMARNVAHSAIDVTRNRRPRR